MKSQKDKPNQDLSKAPRQTKERTCSRITTYTATGPCPICWPRRLKERGSSHADYMKKEV